MSDAGVKIAGHAGASLRQALNALTGKEYLVSLRGKTTEPAVLLNPVIWQQSFSATEGPAFWVAAGRDLWEVMGRAVLAAAGIDEATEEDCRSTWQEINSQTIAGVAAGITADIQKEVSTTVGEEIGEEPAALEWLEFTVNTGEEPEPVFKAAWSASLAGLYEPKQLEPRSKAGRESAVSKTFDLLLDVALPVSVSFGKTSLQIREVLKLNTGSIVELDRLVTDPVEVIVNDCVIARGEVVVVDGNYGVRIHQLASREDRLRTGMADSTRIGLRP